MSTSKRELLEQLHFQIKKFPDTFPAGEKPWGGGEHPGLGVRDLDSSRFFPCPGDFNLIHMKTTGDIMG